MEMEADVPMLRRKVILIRERYFFTAEAGEGFVCVSVGESEVFPTRAQACKAATAVDTQRHGG